MEIGGRYRITSPTLALFEQDGRHIAHTVPTGAIVTVDTNGFDGNKLVSVTWDGEAVMMFTQDLRSRSELVKETSKKPSSPGPRPTT
jgi:hypothetical protein